MKTKEQEQEEEKLQTVLNFKKFTFFMEKLSKLMFPWEEQRIANFTNFIWPPNPPKPIHLDESLKKLLDIDLWKAFL